MEVYLLLHDYDDYRSLDCDDEALEYLVHRTFDATPIADTWQPFHVWWSEEERDKPKGDFPVGGMGIVVGKSVIKAIGRTLLRNGELLPLVAPAEDMWIYNVTTVVDALDATRTRISDHHIYKHVFVEDRLRDRDIFKVPQSVNGNDVYITDRFWAAIKASGLAGLRPKRVWSSETGPTWHSLLF